MIKVKVNNEYKDVVKIFCGGTLQKEITKVWSREAQEYVYESSVERTGSLPITIRANGDALIDYQIYGADGGVGVATENLFDDEITQGAYATGTGSPMTSDRYIKSSKIRLDLNGYITLTFNCPKMGYAISGLDAFIYFWTETDTYIDFFQFTEKGRKTVQIPEGAVYFAFSVGAGAGGTLRTSDISDIMLVEGSTVPISYIPYGYKLPMVTVDQLFDKNTNWFDNVYKDDSGNERTQGRASYTEKYMPCRGNQTLRIEHADGNAYVSFRLYFYDSQKQWIERTTGYTGNDISLTIVTPVNAAYFQVQYEYRNTYYNVNTLMIYTTSTDTPVYIGENQLTEGEYVSFGEQKIYKRTENLYSSENELGNIYFGTGTNEYSDACTRTKDYISVKPSTTYTLKYNLSNVKFATRNYTNSAYLGYYEWQSNGSNFTTGNTTTRIRFIFESPEQLQNIMLVEGSTVPEQYIPYVAPTEPPIPLPEMPTIKGETVIDYDGDPKPSQMYVKYRR